MGEPDALQPFTMHVDDAVLDDLRARLARTRWPDPAYGESWQLGTDLGALRRRCEHWAGAFDWRATEAAYNEWPQYVTRIDGQQIHLFHVRSGRPGALPLLLLHGWPSANTEFVKVFRPLADAGFDVVCPALPGFGWSGPTTRPGWTPHRIAGAFVELMDRLGHDRFAAHGGDWGAMVASQLGLHFPDRVVGIHLNLVIAPPPRDVDDPMALLTDAERARVLEMRGRARDQMGYQEIQATRPASLSAGLNDSPAGLAAWILEKFHAWSDVRGDLATRYTDDELCALLTVYWATGTIHSANRIYAETRRAGLGASMPPERVPVPMAHSRFPADGFATPRPWAERLYDVRAWTLHDEGGHFPAMEVPEALVGDLVAFFGNLHPPSGPAT
jgi:pimeloyl-ACP methyl ester carboxylesterase